MSPLLPSSVHSLQGETNRAIAAHSLNKSSSRSHCVFTIHLEVRDSPPQIS